ncbi:MAG: threonine/serine dehydratase, partial [Burkholderiales bacterium]|nr:threonine/serine dehydratase [Burkholderiales bacterium]
ELVFAGNLAAQPVLDRVEQLLRDQVGAAQGPGANRVVAEPGGAAAFAALESGAYAAKEGDRIGVLLCGANTDAVRFSA